MNREDIIRMAREAMTLRQPNKFLFPFWSMTTEELERFAALAAEHGAAAEREACAAMFDHVMQRGGTTIGDAIRARGEKA